MAGASGGRVKLLAVGEKQVHAAVGADAAANRAGIGEKTGVGCACGGGVFGLRHAAADAGSGGHEVGLVPSVIARPAAGVTEDLVGVRGVRIVPAALIRAPQALHILGRADGDHIFGRGGRGDRPPPVVAVVAGGEDNHHLMIGGGGRFGVAHQRVVGLGIRIVLAVAAGVAPTVVVDSGPALPGGGFQAGNIRIRGVVRIENNGRTEPDKRANPQAIVIARAVFERKAGQVIIAADDMGVERSMSIAATEGAARVGRAFEAIVNDTAAVVGLTVSIQAKVVGRCRPVVNPAVRQVHGEARSLELRLREALALQPRQITRPARPVSRQIPGHNLVLPLIQFLGRKVGHNGNNVRLRGDARQIRRRKPARHIHIMQD